MMRRTAWLLVLLVAFSTTPAAAQSFQFENMTLRDVIRSIEARSDWRFLYRDALIAGLRVSLQSSASSLPNDLRAEVAPHGIGVEADLRRRQILLVTGPRTATPAPLPVATAPTAPAALAIRCRVLDAETGQGLPYATITWREEGALRGAVADLDGNVLATPPAKGALRTILTASFTGYQPVASAPSGTEVTFRLTPVALSTETVVIAASGLVSPLDTSWTSALAPSRYASLAEGGGLRALEVLPSVAPGALFSDGTIVRGSTPDAFDVRLDGIPIYNPRHIFGLTDAFNPDALRAVALHLGVAPAQYSSSPGGSIEYVTSAGSVTKWRARAGLSSLAARASVDGPLLAGRTSILLGGRISTLGTLPWPGGENLVAQGLGADRPTSPLPTSASDPLERVLAYNAESARFHDVHAAISHNHRDGGRTVVTAYTGGDVTSLDADRFVLRSSPGGITRPVQIPVETRNNWGSSSLGLTDRRFLGQRAMLVTSIGGSVYRARFEKDDYSFRLAETPTNPLGQRVDTLGYANRLAEGVATSQLQWVVRNGLAMVGLEAHAYRGSYDEQASIRPRFERSQVATRLDGFTSWSGRVASRFFLDAGIRAQWLTTSSYTRLSPRILVRSDVTPGVTASVSLGRGVQFVNRLTLADVAAAAAWVLPSESEPPTEADQVEAGVALRPGPSTHISISAYAKQTRNQREHAGSLAARQLRDPSILELPWLADVKGGAVGVEFAARRQFASWTLSVLYALSDATIQHPLLADGEPFTASWHRRHQGSLLLDGQLLRGLSVAAAWTLASGLRNPLAAVAPDEPDVLAAIQRLDLRVTFQRRTPFGVASAALAIRNMTDADNVIDREAITLLRTRGDGQRFVLGAVDVYDTGFLPSFDLLLTF